MRVSLLFDEDIVARILDEDGVMTKSIDKKSNERVEV